MVTLLLLMLYLGVIALLILILGVQLPRSHLSHFERIRRVKLGDAKAQAIDIRERALQDVYSIQQLLASLLLVVLTVWSIAALGWWVGIILSILLAVFAGVVSGSWPFSRWSHMLYRRIESPVLLFVSGKAWLRFIRRPMKLRKEQRIESKEELEHLLITAPSEVIPDDYKQEIQAAGAFPHTRVKQIMTKYKNVIRIDEKELLGPLVLDDLHKTGHTLFPVTKKGSLDIVGILSLDILLTIDAKQRSLTAKQAMQSRVCYIHEASFLPELLAAMLDTHVPLFMVINDDEEVVGVVALRDVIRVLRGHDDQPARENYTDRGSISTSVAEEYHQG